MTMLFAHDSVYRRFLARHPGVWGEVGALDDAPFLRKLRRERATLGLPDDRVVPVKRRRFVRKAVS